MPSVAFDTLKACPTARNIGEASPEIPFPPIFPQSSNSSANKAAAQQPRRLGPTFSTPPPQPDRLSFTNDQPLADIFDTPFQAKADTTPLTPLPVVPTGQHTPESKHVPLLRRRSSYPSAVPSTVGSTEAHLWSGGSTPAAKPLEITKTSSSDSGFGAEEHSSFPWTALDGNTMIKSEDTPKTAPRKLASIQMPSLDRSFTGSPKRAAATSIALHMSRAESAPDKLGLSAETLAMDRKQPEAGPSRTSLHQPPSNSSRWAQFGSDLAWKTILKSVVEVEAVGEVGVSRVLQEVWKRGGGDVVTSQCLWPSIIMSLVLSPTSSDDHTEARTSTPSASASMALQELYNLTLRHWEPTIFSGLLSSFIAGNTTEESAAPTSAAAFNFPPVSVPRYGASTPTKEFDNSLAQWTNLTPGLGGELTALLGGASMSPRNSMSHPHSNLGQFEFTFEPERPSSSQSISGIDEILASMEEGQAAHEREENQAAAVANDTPAPSSPPPPSLKKRSSEFFTYQLPTPETDSDVAPARARVSKPAAENDKLVLSPESMASPYVTGSSGIASNVSRELSTSQSQISKTRPAAPTNLTMPTDSFIPPPPMCMFFNPSFRDLQQGKVGVWKGDLELKGTGGGKFNVLIVGEEVSGHLWQSHQWSPSISYPPGSDTADNATSSFTSKMIPVAYLAREGFTPVTMGMVLCNDPQIEKYVAMVQSLHAEGVAFHLPNPANLPIVFLPAKFEPNDPLQRLGIAYMAKPGAPIPVATVPKVNTDVSESEETANSRRKRRRQSAPARANSGSKRRDTRSSRHDSDGIAEE